MKRLQRIEEKLDSIRKMLQEHFLSEMENVTVPSQRLDIPLSIPISVYLLKLPDSLRKTMLSMERLKEATTTQVSEVTERSRSLESIYLNQLERLGYLEKFRKGKKIFFRIPKKTPEEKENSTKEALP